MVVDDRGGIVEEIEGTVLVEETLCRGAPRTSIQPESDGKGVVSKGKEVVELTRMILTHKNYMFEMLLTGK